MVDLIESQLYSSDQMFTHKTYDDQKSSFAYLVVPTASFVKYIGNFKDILKARTTFRLQIFRANFAHVVQNINVFIINQLHLFHICHPATANQ